MKKIVYFDTLDLTELPGSPEAPDVPWPDAAPVFGFQPESLSSYGSPPAASLQFAVPAADMPRVRAWFSGDYHGVTEPESDRLVRNYTAAVRATLNSYFDAVARAGLVASPLTAAWRYRLFDGSAIELSPPQIIAPQTEGPYLPIIGHTLGENTLITAVNILSSPSRLTVSVPPVAIPDEYRGAITSLEILIGAAAPFYSPACSVASPRTVVIDGVRRQCWWYDRYTADEVAAAAAASPLTLAAVIPLVDLLSGLPATPLTLLAPSAGAPSVGAPSVIPSSVGDFLVSEAPLRIAPASLPSEAPLRSAGVSAWSPWLRVSTGPLDLGLPEHRKRIRALTLRGIFDRSSVHLRLYGAHHRPNPLDSEAESAWRLIGASDSPHITALCGAPCRWLRVEIELRRRPADRLDYLLFHYR